MGGQLVAGLGNLLFAVVMAHVLAPGEYADVVSFLALFVLLHVPGVAVERGRRPRPRPPRPPAAARVRRRRSPSAPRSSSGRRSSADVIGLPTSFVVLLGIAAPEAALLSLHRGLAYGRERLARVTTSLVAEAGVRVAVGVSLAMALGPVGAAAGCVLAGYTGFAVVRHRGAVDPVGPPRADDRGRRADLVARHAGRRRCRSWPSPCCSRPTCSSPTACSTSDDAAAFGVLSTIGGAAFFATATIPLVLMPAARRGRASARPGRHRA